MTLIATIFLELNAVFSCSMIPFNFGKNQLHWLIVTSLQLFPFLKLLIAFWNPRLKNSGLCLISLSWLIFFDVSPAPSRASSFSTPLSVSSTFTVFPPQAFSRCDVRKYQFSPLRLHPICSAIWPWTLSQKWTLETWWTWSTTKWPGVPQNQPQRGNFAETELLYWLPPQEFRTIVAKLKNKMCLTKQITNQHRIPRRSLRTALRKRSLQWFTRAESWRTQLWKIGEHQAAVLTALTCLQWRWRWQWQWQWQWQ